MAWEVFSLRNLGFNWFLTPDQCCSTVGQLWGNVLPFCSFFCYFLTALSIFRGYNRLQSNGEMHQSINIQVSSKVPFCHPIYLMVWCPKILPPWYIFSDYGCLTCLYLSLMLLSNNSATLSTLTITIWMGSHYYAFVLRWCQAIGRYDRPLIHVNRPTLGRSVVKLPQFTHLITLPLN